MDNIRVTDTLNRKIKLIDETLNRYIPEEGQTPGIIHEAMRYSIFAGGKRLRPVLVLTAAEAVGGEALKALPAGCALEMIHTYSLIHDDLPSMDNDDYRRGKPTSHKVYGEAFAILAGDALLTAAFEMMAAVDDIPPAVMLQVIREIARAAGSQGMIGGQVVDIQSENKMIDKSQLKYIHDHKTGALFRASLRVGGLIGGATESQLEKLTAYADNLGLAFQITDDILDVEGNTETLGKTAGSDERKNKSTYPSLYGLEASKGLAAEAVQRALDALKDFDSKADLLRYVAQYMTYRDK